MRHHQKKILHIVDSLSMGGAETWLMQLVSFRCVRDIDLPEFDFIATSGREGVFDREALSYGCRIYYLKLDKGNSLSFVRGFRKILGENSYLAIHDHQDYLSGWHFLFGLGLLPRCRVTHFHNPYYQLSNNYGVTFMRRMNLRLGRLFVKAFSTHILGTSERLLSQYGVTEMSYPFQRIGPLFCAFDTAAYRGTHLEAKREICEELGLPFEKAGIVLFAGRLDMSTELDHPMNHKNSRFALEVLRSSKDNELYMLMAGLNAPVRDAFMGIVRQYGLEDRVILLGIRRDMPKLMLAADVLLFPSRSEGMGMVAVEAQAAGLPVLASDQVPEEVVVLEELVAFSRLDSPFEAWAERLSRMMAFRLEQDSTEDERWKSSGFNIEVCWNRLMGYYTQAG